MAVEPSFVVRIGLAVAKPQAALALAGGRRHPGRSGSDLLSLILLVLAATQLRGIAGGIWMAVAVDVGLGVQAVIRVMTRSLTIDLAFLVVAAVLIYGIAGKRRDLGRAFDLACVATLPLLLVELAATTIVRLFDVPTPAFVGTALLGVSFAWAGVLLALATRVARVAPAAIPVVEPSPIGRKAGLGVLAVVAIGLVIGVVWILRNLDLMRPVKQGDPAPVFALPHVADAEGKLGPSYALQQSIGRPVVIDFWATWCKPCIAQLPTLESIGRRGDVDVITINLDDPGRAFSMFVAANYRAMALLADDGEVSQRFNVSRIPHTVLIDKAGRVREVLRGGHDLAAALQPLR